jgi:hypothetical protein
MEALPLNVRGQHAWTRMEFFLFVHGSGQTAERQPLVMTSGLACLTRCQHQSCSICYKLPQKLHLLVKITKDGTNLKPLPQKWYLYVIYSSHCWIEVT